MTTPKLTRYRNTKPVRLPASVAAMLRQIAEHRGMSSGELIQSEYGEQIRRAFRKLKRGVK